MKTYADYHVHTTLSSCCADPRQTVENIIARQLERGMKIVAITDHLWHNPALPPSAWYAPQSGPRLLPRRHEIRAAATPGLRLLFGCEADMRAPGKFGMTPEFKQNFDLVLLSSDHFHMREFVEQPQPRTPENFARLMLEFFRSAASCGMADILAHPLFTMGHDEIYDRTVAAVSDAEFADALGLAAAHNVAIEINGTLLRKQKMKQQFSLESMLRIFSIAKASGCRFTFGSDAHAISDLDNISFCEEFADRLGLTESDFAVF